MKNTIKILLAVASWFEQLAESTRDKELTRLDKERDKAYKQEAEASKRNTEEWNAEVARHKRKLEQLEDQAIADEEHLSQVVASINQRCKEVELV